MNKLSVVGVPLVCGEPTAGCGGGPTYYRENGLLVSLGDGGVSVEDLGDVDVGGLGEEGEDDRALYLDGVAKQAASAYDALNTRLKEDFYLFLGGDCGLCLATVPVLRQWHTSLNVVWFDAHGDFNTPETTPSGFVGGMVLAALVGLGPKALTEATGSSPVVRQDHVALLAYRDLDPKEEEMLDDSDVYHAPYADGDLPDQVAAFLEVTEGPVMVHLDVDALDASVFGGLGYPTPGGPGLGETEEAFRRIAKTGRLASVEVASLDVEASEDGQDAGTVASLLSSLLNSRD